MKFITILQYAIPSSIIFLLNKYVPSMDGALSQLIYPIGILLSIYISSLLTDKETKKQISDERDNLKSLYDNLLSKQNKRHVNELSVVKEKIKDDIVHIIHSETIKKVTAIEKELTLERNRIHGIRQRSDEIKDELDVLYLENEYYQSEKIKHNDNSQRLLDLIRSFHHSLEQVLKQSNINSNEIEKINELSIILHENIDEFSNSIQDIVRQEQLRNVNKRLVIKNVHPFKSPLNNAPDDLR